MKSKRERLRALLDTPFILPSLGIDTGREVLDGLQKLAKIGAEIYYSRFSILESLWIATALISRGAFDAQLFSLGLRSIMEGERYRRLEETSQAFADALTMCVLGHRDVVDNILYADSVHFNLKLLTVDRDLRKFVRERGLKDTLLFPAEL